MPRRKKEAVDDIEGPSETPTSDVELLLLVSPNCPFCKLFLRHKTVRYYISHGVIKVIDTSIMPFTYQDVGEYVLTDGGLVLQVTSPTFLIVCQGKVLSKYRLTQGDVFNDSIAVMYVYLYNRVKKSVCASPK